MSRRISLTNIDATPGWQAEFYNTVSDRERPVIQQAAQSLVFPPESLNREFNINAFIGGV